MCSWLLQDEQAYNPDTIDLNNDEEAARYWFPCFRDIIQKYSTQAAISQKNDDTTANVRAQNFYESYLCKLQAFEEKRSIEYKNLSVRKLLELIDMELRKNGFFDPWQHQKQIENIAAMSQLTARLTEIDAISDITVRWSQLIRGVIAGNMFDSGARAVDQLLERSPGFSLNSALMSIQQRPWLIDNLDEFIIDLKQNVAHKCALIFVDNSGVDIVLGILPFTRELLRRGTKVLLCANSEPSLNDVTAQELQELLENCACKELMDACADQRLLVFPNGQHGPCLDMRTLPQEVNEALCEHGVDLLVIEGMGRALHTNLYAKFKCDTLKLVVIKNQWLAERLGGNIFSVICKYEMSTTISS